jgi:4,5-DOPA dioxygenase extradiol
VAGVFDGDGTHGIRFSQTRDESRHPSASPDGIVARPARDRQIVTVVGSVGTDRRDQTDRRAPAIFVSHGSPLALVDADFKQALRVYAAHLRPPLHILVVSAHWTSVRPLRVTSSARPDTLHEFEGFPSWLSSVTYKCPGAPALAESIVATLAGAGIAAMPDPRRGLDSGAWGPLSLLYPNAKVPVVQLSLPAPAAPADMLAIGAALAPLRREGVMLLGSGGIVHNPSWTRFNERDPRTEPWAAAFDDWVRERVESLDVDTLANYRTRGPMPHLAAPTSEHLDPLFFVLGARLAGDRVSTLSEGFHAGNLSLRSFVLAGRRDTDRRLPDELSSYPPSKPEAAPRP